SPSNDIREQIIIDLLLVSLGLSQKLLKHAESSKSRMRQGLKQGIRSTKQHIQQNPPQKIVLLLMDPPYFLVSHAQTLCDIFINLATYDARYRAVLCRLARHLELSSSLIPNLKKSIGQQLYFMQQEALKPEPGGGKETKKADIYKDLDVSALQKF
ncbi:4236_t:CDS:1, partial [Paraglomus occultum]